MKVQFVETKLRVIESIELPEDADLKDMLKGRGYYSRSTEAVWLVAYDASRSMRYINEIARGTHHNVEISIPTLMSALWAASADRFMLVHNHPSGRVEPSDLDVNASATVMKAANACGVFYEDFVIIGPGGEHYSFAEHGVLVPATPSQPLAAFGEPILLR